MGKHAQPSQHDDDQEHRDGSDITQPHQGAVWPVEHLRKNAVVYALPCYAGGLPRYRQSLCQTFDPGRLQRWRCFKRWRCGPGSGQVDFLVFLPRVFGGKRRKTYMGKLIYGLFVCFEEAAIGVSNFAARGHAELAARQHDALVHGMRGYSEQSGDFFGRFVLDQQVQNFTLLGGQSDQRVLSQLFIYHHFLRTPAGYSPQQRLTAYHAFLQHLPRLSNQTFDKLILYNKIAGICAILVIFCTYKRLPVHPWVTRAKYASRITERSLYSSALTRRTGRVISTARAVLALLFLLVLWVDPAVPLRGDLTILLLVSLYLLWTAFLVVLAWRSWWLDFRLAGIAQGIDIAVFLTAIYFTENRFTEFQSPFLAFAAFLLVAAMTRWSWRATAVTAIIVLTANLAIGVAMVRLGLDIDLFRFARRTAYMIVLSSILIWLSLSRGGGRIIPFSEPPGLLGGRREQLLDSALALIGTVLGARQVVLAFAANEEPWVEFRHRTPEGITIHREGPGNFGDQLTSPAPTALFNVAKSRMIAFEDPGVVAWTAPVRSQLAHSYRINEGVLVPLQSATGGGQIIAWDCETLSVDDLAMLRALGDQIGHALDRDEMAGLARSAAENSVRHAVARDLHDSVAQFLAGTLFRLEALRRWIREGHDPEGEIDSIKNALRREQSHLRQLIERLRRGEEGDRRTEIADEMRDLLTEAGAHWHIETELVLPDHPQSVSVQLSHEIRQLVREAIANAVRHGKCRKVCVTLSDENGLLKLTIADDGTGFPDHPSPVLPRSISERVAALGGRFHVASTGSGARLDIAIHTGEFA